MLSFGLGHRVAGGYSKQSAHAAKPSREADAKIRELKLVHVDDDLIDADDDHVDAAPNRDQERDHGADARKAPNLVVLVLGE